MLIDDLSISIIALCTVRFFGLTIHIILFIKKRNLAMFLLMIGWAVYLAGPLSVLPGYLSPESGLPAFFPFSAAVGIIIIMFGVILNFRVFSVKIINISIVSAVLLLTVLFLLLPGLEGLIATIVQGIFLLTMLLTAVFDRRFLWKDRAQISFFWFCTTLFFGLFHAFGFNLFISQAPLAIRFILTGMLNMSLLLFLTFLDWEQTQNAIEASVHEKEILLQEVHHRVKNNLMIISSMVRLQSANIDDDDTLGLVKNIENRILSMALIHEQFYQNHTFRSIDFSDYLTDLAEMIKSGFEGEDRNVEMIVEIEQVDFEMNKLIPLGMLINEIVTNSFKHAFAETEKPAIYIGMRKAAEDKCVIMISDNGSGFGEQQFNDNKNSTGFVIIDALAKQMDADLTVNHENGTEYMIIVRRRKKV